MSTNPYVIHVLFDCTLCTLPIRNVHKNQFQFNKMSFSCRYENHLPSHRFISTTCLSLYTSNITPHTYIFPFLYKDTEDTISVHFVWFYSMSIWKKNTQNNEYLWFRHYDEMIMMMMVMIWDRYNIIFVVFLYSLYNTHTQVRKMSRHFYIYILLFSFLFSGWEIQTRSTIFLLIPCRRHHLFFCSLPLLLLLMYIKHTSDVPPGYT